jgi:hypothetical protein
VHRWARGRSARRQHQAAADTSRRVREPQERHRPPARPAVAVPSLDPHLLAEVPQGRHQHQVVQKRTSAWHLLAEVPQGLHLPQVHQVAEEQRWA